MELIICSGNDFMDDGSGDDLVLAGTGNDSINGSCENDMGRVEKLRVAFPRPIDLALLLQLPSDKCQLTTSLIGW